MSVQKLLMLGQFFIKSGTENLTSIFVLSSEAISCYPVIESFSSKLIRSIMCFRPWVTYIVLLLSPKDASGSSTIQILMLEGRPGACRAEHSTGDYIYMV